MTSFIFDIQKRVAMGDNGQGVNVTSCKLKVIILENIFKLGDKFGSLI